MIGVGENLNLKRPSDVARTMTDRMPFFSPDDTRITEVYCDVIEKIPSTFHGFMSRQGSHFMTYLSANLLFSMGGDGVGPAMTAFLSDTQIAQQYPAEVAGLQTALHMESVVMDYIKQRPKIEDLIKKMRQPGATISMSDLSFLEGNVTSLKTYVIDQIKQFSSEKPIDLVELDALGQVVAVGSMVAKEDSEKVYQDSDTLAAMGAWIQDVTLLGRYPEVYDQMDSAVHRSIAVLPQQRYNVEFLTDVVCENLGRSKSLSGLTPNTEVRVVGRVKSLSSHLNHAFQDDRIKNIMNGLVPEGERSDDSTANLNRILNDNRDETREDREQLVALLKEAALFQYDKIGCRIQAATPKQFNRLARILSLYTDPQIAVKKLAQIVGNHESIYYPALNQSGLHDYVRQSIYSFDNEGRVLLDKTNRHPNMPEKFRLSRSIIRFIKDIPDHKLGYAALHAASFAKVSRIRNNQITERPVMFEFQLSPWQEGIQSSYSALNALYHSDLYRGIRMHPHEIDALRKASIDGINTWEAQLKK